MEPLKKAVENRKAPFEIEGKAGGRVISLRVSERMEQLLEEQAQEWNMSISDTLRSILNFYFLPPLLLEAWEKKVQALIELDTQQTGKNRADMNAPTQAQRIEPVLVDSEEAEEYAKKEAEKNARDIVIQAVQRYAAEYTAENTVSIVTLPNDDMKGRIIGREGRNIRTFEMMTGVDLIIDDTPEAVIISSFDPIRREIARIALEKLILDGRIHPARIEELIERAKTQVEEKIIQEGEQALFDTGIKNVNSDLVKLLGKLYYRTSYGQNVLQHSKEVTHFAGIMASELGLNVNLAKRAGLLHDIGKSLDHEIEGPHAKIGAELAERYGEKWEIIHAIEAHHNDIEPQTIEAILIQAADAISASRPGARRESLEAYIKRLEQLEKISNSFDGVEKSYAIQAGREVRIIVKPEKVDDALSAKLAYDIVKKIEKELEYPGQIKVTVIRETRAVEYAK